MVDSELDKSAPSRLGDLDSPLEFAKFPRPFRAECAQSSSEERCGVVVQGNVTDLPGRNQGSESPEIVRRLKRHHASLRGRQRPEAHLGVHEALEEDRLAPPEHPLEQPEGGDVPLRGAHEREDARERGLGAGDGTRAVALAAGGARQAALASEAVAVQDAHGMEPVHHRRDGVGRHLLRPRGLELRPRHAHVVREAEWPQAGCGAR